MDDATETTIKRVPHPWHNAWRKRREEAEKELEEAKHEARCSDDIRLDQPLVGMIAEIQRHREKAEQELAEARKELDSYKRSDTALRGLNETYQEQARTTKDLAEQRGEALRAVHECYFAQYRRSAVQTAALKLVAEALTSAPAASESSSALRRQEAPNIDAQVNDVLIVMHTQMQLRLSDDSFPAFADWKDCLVAKCAADAYLMVLRERGQRAPICQHAHKTSESSSWTDVSSLNGGKTSNDSLSEVEQAGPNFEGAGAETREDIPYSNSPCGHVGQYAYTNDGGKHILCLLCEYIDRNVSSSKAHNAALEALRTAVAVCRNPLAFDLEQTALNFDAAIRSLQRPEAK
jgi:hypothetical protein